MRDAVLVEVLPHLQACEIGVIGVDHAVGVGVEGGEREESGLRRPAEHLRDARYLAVAVLIEHEEAVVGAHPAGLLLEPVVVEIELAGAGDGGRKLDTVAVEVENKGVLRREGADRLRPLAQQRHEGVEIALERAEPAVAVVFPVVDDGSVDSERRVGLL